MSATAIETALVEIGSAAFLCGLVHLAWTTHQRLASADAETPPPPAWTPPPPPPGFSVQPWDP
jgi:hypothetical protein